MSNGRISFKVGYPTLGVVTAQSSNLKRPRRRAELALKDAWAEIAELQTRLEDSEAREFAVRLRLHRIKSLLGL
ncbi:hypothetical protein Tco_0888638 [Tanacetum coccineum]